MTKGLGGGFQRALPTSVVLVDWPEVLFGKHCCPPCNKVCTENRVEVADSPPASFVRDTQNRDLGTLVFGSAEWRAFLGSVKDSTR